MSDVMAFAVLMGVVGLTVGSFLNVCVSRWPKGESVVSPRSRCPRCGHEIRWYENIPVLSWLALRARCAGCGLGISVQYPLVELVVGALWAGVAWQAGPTATAVREAVFGTLLLGILLTDFQAYEIPDGFTITGLVFALLTAFVAPLLPGGVGPFATLPDALIGACTGAGLIAIAGWLGERWLKQEAMGFGDVTLMAMVGAFIGPWRAILTVFVGAFIGVVAFVVLAPVLKRRTVPDDIPSGPSGMAAIPFGVFLAPAAFVVLLWGHVMIQWYLDTFLPA
jgi:leader peptidase (prepilin peptidase) / N-methyltransferase